MNSPADIQQAITKLKQIDEQYRSLAENQAKQIESLGKERDEAISKVCPNPSTHNSNGGGDHPTSTITINSGLVSDPSNGDNTDPTPQPPSLSFDPLQAIVNVIKRLFGGDEYERTPR